jgi:hypothetical protein
VLVIMFKTGHALPLVGTRFLRPRSSRGESAEQPREVCGSWPRARKIRDLDSVGHRPCPQTIRVREQSVSAFSPRPQSRPQAIHVLNHASASTVHEQAADMTAHSSQAVHRPEPAASADSPRTRIVRVCGLAKSCPGRRVVVSILPPINFPVHIQIIPAYVLI